MHKMQTEEQFETTITARNGWFDINFRELWKYRDLMLLFVRRNFVALYKQTILGPAWAIIQPLLTTVMFTVVFGNLAGLSAVENTVTLKKKLKDFLKNPKRIFYLETDEFGNVGDHLINSAVTEFFKKHFPEYSLLEISAPEYSIYRPFLLKYITEKDLIVTPRWKLGGCISFCRKYPYGYSPELEKNADYNVPTDNRLF